MKQKLLLFLSVLLTTAGAWADPTDLPEITTDLNNPIYYTILNTRSKEPGGLMYWAGDDVGMKDACNSFALEDKYKFYFTGSHDKLYVHNAATDKKLATIGNGNKSKGSWTESGTAWAVGISPKGGGLAFGPSGGLNGNACWNECNYDTGAGNPDFTTWSANDDGSVFVVEKASDYFFPQAGKVYTIEAPLFEKVQKVKKGLVENTDGTLGWNTVDLTNKNYFWTIEVNSDGALYVKNVGSGKYINGEGLADEPKNATIRVKGSGQFNIVVNGVTIHANGHEEGTAGSGNIVSWDGGIGSASAWSFVEDFSEIVIPHRDNALSILNQWKESNLSAVFDAYALTDAITNIESFPTKEYATIAKIDDELKRVTDGIASKRFAFRNSDLASSVRVNAFLSVDLSESRAHGTKTLNRYGIWRLESANAGAFYIYNIEQKGYLKTPSDNCRFVADKAEAAQYTFEIVDAATNKVELKCNGQTLHLNNHSNGKISNFDNNDAASRWYVLDETDPGIGLFLALASDETQNYFSDGLYSELKADVTSSEGIANAELKELVGSLLSDAVGYKKFRVAEYEPYRTVTSLQRELKTSAPYNKWENPTGIYLKEGESCVVAVSGIGEDPVGLKIKNWVTNQNESSYSLVNGLNYITATSEGNVFVDYYTDNYKTAGNVKLHFINAPVRGYWDQKTMTNDDWTKMLGKLENDNSVIVVRSEHAQLAYPVSAWKNYCPEDVYNLMTLYQQVQWAQRDMMGLKKYGREAKNRQLFYANLDGPMAAGQDGAYCSVGSLKSIMTPDSKVFDFWGVGHEWGHNNQINGFHWSGCGETTNNIYASWGQIHGNPSNLRLEDEVTGIDEYSSMRGGRMQTYFEEGLRKGVQWQLQDGPDYHNATPKDTIVTGYDYDGNSKGEVTTTWRNYDHFVKLSPFWQLNLWGTLAGNCPDIIPMVIESIRTTENYTSTYNTNGKQQINWMKLACDNAQIDLLPFFEKAGMLKPINAYIEDYGAGWNKINDEMIDNLKSYVASKGYPAFTEEINYINGHNYHIYRDNLKLSVPGTLGEGCEQLVGKVKVDHNKVKNAVAFETYNSADELIRITMYGLGSDDAHSYTQVLYPAGAAYIMAVGYDGERKEIYRKEGWTDKSCVIECPLFKQKKGVHRGLYVKDDGALAWGEIDVANDNFKWIVTKTEDDIIVLKNKGAGTYLNGSNMSESPVKCSINYVGEEQYNIIVNGVTLHANNHGGGNGVGSDIVSWAGGAGSASAWELNEIMDFSYSFLFNGEEVRTQKAGTRFVGQDYPEIVWEEKYGVVTPTTPEGQIPDEVASDGTFCKTIDLKSSLPFVPAKDYGSIKHWYYMTISAHKYHLFYEKEATSMNVNGKTTVPSDKKDAYSWAFIGDPFNGFQIVNRGAGEGKILSSSTTMAGTDGGGTYPVLTDTPVPDGNNTHWVLSGGNPLGDVTGFFIAQKDNGANRMNFRSPYLAYWTRGADDGSTFLVRNRTSEDLDALLPQAKEMVDKGGEKIGCYDPSTIANLSQVMANVENKEEPTFEDVEVLENAVNGVRFYTPPYVYALKSNAGDAYLSLIELENGYNGGDNNVKSAAQYSDTPTYFTLISENNKGYVMKVSNMDDRYLGKSSKYSWNASNTDKTTWVIEPKEAGSDVYYIKQNATGDAVYLGNKDGIGANGSYKYIYTDQKLAEVSSKENLQWVFLQKMDVSISSAKAATLFTPIAVSIPDGVTAKYVKAEGDNIGSEGRLLYTQLNGIIPANTAVVLTGEQGTYTFLETKETGEQVVGNVLFGYAEKTAVGESEHTTTGEDGTVYALANKDKGVAFYHYVGANYSAGKAYLDVKDLSAGTGVRLFNIFDEETETGVTETESEHVKTEIYDLTGRRVREARNGLYIVNGKRVIR